jgi:hypothetical protein
MRSLQTPPLHSRGNHLDLQNFAPGGLKAVLEAPVVRGLTVVQPCRCAKKGTAQTGKAALEWMGLGRGWSWVAGEGARPQAAWRTGHGTRDTGHGRGHGTRDTGHGRTSYKREIQISATTGASLEFQGKK